MWCSGRRSRHTEAVTPAAAHHPPAKPVKGAKPAPAKPEKKVVAKKMARPAPKKKAKPAKKKKKR